MTLELVISVPPLVEGVPRLRAVDLLFRASTFDVEAHGRTVLQRPPDGLQVLEIVAPASPLTTFTVGNAASVLDESYAHARRWLATA